MMGRIVEFVEITRQDDAGTWHPWCCVAVEEWIHGAFQVRLPLVLDHKPYQWKYIRTRYYPDVQP